MSPELELWEAAHKGPELLVRFGGQRGPLKLRVHLGAVAAGAGTHAHSQPPAAMAAGRAGCGGSGGRWSP